ncbi:hypothetical protein GUJ93_ZPchr0005g14312 [Zizania palustris]|uniref:Glycosyltransferase 2-like domain-containing protein n=1 Tax=Zizania palustris TaxID=103762 RepID=A0A8J5T4U1_ZIZPA|nr:hypothetical protein GUJ93_ZPchr0005g14312 [Zizania palustris]
MNGPFILNLDCDHYVHNSAALREGMCFMLDRSGNRVCFVQFPQRFEGIDPNDRYRRGSAGRRRSWRRSRWRSTRGGCSRTPPAYTAVAPPARSPCPGSRSTPRSVYCVTRRDAFCGTAPTNLTDRLHQVLRWATGSVEIFSRNNALFASPRMKLLQRVTYFNAGMYPFTSVFLLIYCLLSAVSLFSGKFIVQHLSATFLVRRLGDRRHEPAPGRHPAGPPQDHRI